MTARAKIAIVGFTDHAKQAPFGDPAWQIWSLNDHYLDIPTVPAERLVWFQMHDWTAILETPHGKVVMPPAARDGLGHIAWLDHVSRAGTVYLSPQARPEVPMARALPRAELFAYFGSNYFTNSVAFMLGLAIMQLVPDGPGTPAIADAEIAVYGVDMMVAGGQGSEYGWQRPSCEWLLGWARAAGIRVTIPAESDLLKTAFPYGDAIGNAWRKKLQAYRTEMSRRRGVMTQQRDEAMMAIAELTGAINAADHWLLSWMPGDSEEPAGGRVPMPNSHKVGADGVAGPAELIGASPSDGHEPLEVLRVPPRPAFSLDVDN